MQRAGKLMFLSLLAAFSLAAPANALTAERLIHGGGPIGYCTILCSFFGLAIALEHMVTVRKSRLAPAAVVDEIERHLASGDVDGAIEVCGRENNFVTSALAAALPKRAAGSQSRASRGRW